MLTVIWGGRYCPIIPCGVLPQQIGYAERWLANASPDFVCGIGVDHDFWRKRAHECCRPLRYYEVGEDDPLSVLFRNLSPDPVPVDPAFDHILALHPGMEKSRFFHLEPGETSLLSVVIAAMFGYLPEGRAKGVIRRLKGEYKEIDRPSPVTSFFEAQKRKDRQTLLDAGSFRLEGNTMSGNVFAVPPTIVPMANCGADLALFWNWRMQPSLPMEGMVCAIPSDTALTEAEVSQLAVWLRSFGGRANYCRIVCLPHQSDYAQALARRLRPRVAGSGIKHVDVVCDYGEPPVTVGRERAVVIPATRQGECYTFAAPAPSFADYMRAPEWWMVDLVRDCGTGQAPGQSVPPPFRVTAHEVLNAPAPPTMGRSYFDPLRYGIDGISVRTKMGEKMLSYRLPTGQELIGEHLRECGMVPTNDDKRPLYEAAIGFFGSMWEAAQSCRPPFRRMLAELMGNPLLEAQVKCKANLGSVRRSVAEVPFMGKLYKDEPVRERVGRERFQEYTNSHHPIPGRCLNALDYWVEKGVLRQAFQTPSCPACRRSNWLESVDMSKPILCGDCGRPIPIGGSLNIGYRLEPIVRAALHDGLAPVVLTGQFLHGLSHQGFQWVPGLHVTKDGQEQDIDIVALCDGHLVMTECKGMEGAGPGAKCWNGIREQFEKVIYTARACSAEVVFLASLTEEYPQCIRNLANDFSDKKMSVHLLAKTDLDSGFRSEIRVTNGKEVPFPLSIGGFLPPGDRPPRKKRRGKRELRM